MLSRIFVIVLLASTTALAASPTADLAKARRLVEVDLRFSDAIGVLRRALADPNLTRTQRVEGYRLLATAYVASTGAASVRRVLAQLERVAATTATILIQGDTGTGKELIARAVHQHSSRADGPFVVVDCAAVTQYFDCGVLSGILGQAGVSSCSSHVIDTNGDSIPDCVDWDCDGVGDVCF